MAALCEAVGSGLTGPVRNERTRAKGSRRHSCRSRSFDRCGSRILRKDLRARLPPLPVIVHAAPTASRAAAPSLAMPSAPLTHPTRRGERHLRGSRRGLGTRGERTDRPRGGIKAGLTVDRRRPDRSPVCRIRAKVPAAAIMGAAYEQVTDVIAAGECLPLKGFAGEGAPADVGSNVVRNGGYWCAVERSVGLPA
jgi:hypothetical protein